MKERRLRWLIFWWVVGNVAIAIGSEDIWVGVLTATVTSIPVIATWDRRRRPQVYDE